MFWSLCVTTSYNEHPQILPNSYIKLKTNSSMICLPCALEIATARRLKWVVYLTSRLSKGKAGWREVISKTSNGGEMAYVCWVPHGQNSLYTLLKLLHHWTQSNLHKRIFYLIYEERILDSKWGSMRFLCLVFDKKNQAWKDLFTLMMNKCIKNKQTKNKTGNKDPIWNQWKDSANWKEGQDRELKVYKKKMKKY